MSEVKRWIKTQIPSYSYNAPEYVLASDYDAKAAECERLRKAVHDLQLFVQDSRGLKIIADALSPTEGANEQHSEVKPCSA